MNLMDVSVIIVNYNTRQLLCDCLQSIKSHTKGVDYEVIVVDNDSKDDSREVVERDFPWVKWVQSKENLGFGRANNLGIEHSSGKYLFFLNSDTILLNNALKYFYDYSEANPGFGALGAILVDRKLNPVHSYGKFPTQLRLIKDVIAKYIRILKDKSCQHPDFVDEPLYVEYITGADLWVPRSVYDNLGGFDPDYFMYQEELDWQLRMCKSGLKRIIIPCPKIIHLEGGSETIQKRGWSPNRMNNFRKSQAIYQRKHFNKSTYHIFKLIYNILDFPARILTNLRK